MDDGGEEADHAYGMVFIVSAGRLDEILAEVRRASALGPLSLSINTSSGMMFNYGHRYDAAVE